jgi:adenosine deaminase
MESWWPNSAFLFPPPNLLCNKEKNRFKIFLNQLRFGYNFLNSAEAYAAVVKLYAMKAISSGIRYAELQLNYALISTWEIPLVDLLTAIGKAVESLKHQICLRFVIDLPWQFPASMLTSIIDTFDEIKQFGMGAISMGGDERLARPKEVSFVFKEARNAGLKVLCHAGETTSYDIAKSIVETLEPHRVTHAISIAEWITNLGKEAPVIDVCPSSNLALEVIPNLSDHPISDWLAANVPMCISTDDPAIFQTDLLREYSLIENQIPGFLDNPDLIKKWWIKGAIDEKSAREALQKKYDPFFTNDIIEYLNTNSVETIFTPNNSNASDKPVI